jgi:hypothetical protein
MRSVLRSVSPATSLAQSSSRSGRGAAYLDPDGTVGVRWPTASVLLHFGHRDRYPILDYRALETLGVTEPVNYTVPFWNAYVAACRQIDDQTGFGMRTIDRAMWQ